MSTNEFETLTYNEYFKYANDVMAKHFGSQNPTIDDIENLYWKNILKENKYGCNNEMSLFGDNVDYWNLDRFTSKESNIHFRQTHHNEKVRISINDFSQGHNFVVVHIIYCILNKNFINRMLSKEFIPHICISVHC